MSHLSPRSDAAARVTVAMIVGCGGSTVVPAGGSENRVTENRQSAFPMLLRWRVHSPPVKPWKVFVHFDGSGVRLSADHTPGFCGAARWKPGDIVEDVFDVSAGTKHTPAGNYDVFIGWFSGSHGNRKNAEVTAGHTDPYNRTRVGHIRLR